MTTVPNYPTILTSMTTQTLRLETSPTTTMNCLFVFLGLKMDIQLGQH
jgi:hypothetical protein